MDRPFDNPDVAAVFAAYPQPVGHALLALRALILDTAADLSEGGEIEETLRWGQPSYLTTQSKSGSMIRIDRVKNTEGRYALYVHCQTSLIDAFKERYSNELTYEGNRALLFDVNTPLPVEALRYCVQLALTYRLRKRSGGTFQTKQEL